MVAGDSLPIRTPVNRVLALDPATGATRWTFDPRIKIAQSFAEDFDLTRSLGLGGMATRYRVPPVLGGYFLYC